MKTIMIILAASLMLHLPANAAFISNTMTTNADPVVLNLITNIAKGQVGPTLSPSVLQAAGGLTTNPASFTAWVDPAGAAFTAQEEAISAASVYTDNEFIANPVGWISSAATNHITKFDTNVVTSIVAGTGLSLSSSLDATGYHYTLQATGTNNASITNLNPTVLAQAGGLTTNNFGTYADPLGSAQNATNGYAWSGLYDTNNAAKNATNGFPWSGLYDTNGMAKNATNWGNIRFTNLPVVGSILLSSNMTVSYTTNGQGIIVATIGSIASASGVFQPAATNLYQWAGIGTNQVVIGTNIIGQLVGGANVTLTAVTNGSGLVTVTINASPGSGTFQPASDSLTNWSTITTNQIILNTNLVKAIVAGSNISISATTNRNGITYTVGETAAGVIIRAGSFTASSGGSGAVTFSSTMGSTPIVTFAQDGWGTSSLGDSEVIITSRSATGFGWSNARDTSGVSKNVFYIATLPQ